jgi:hypothetical protein
MNYACARHLGLYRPKAFEPNKFFCLHTKYPNNHLDAIYRTYKKSEMIDARNLTDDMELITAQPIVIYTRLPYTNYESIHFQMVNKLKGLTIKSSHVKYWPIVTIEEEICTALKDLDKFIIENILDKKE